MSQLTQQVNEKLVTLRHWLHANPECSGNEINTAAHIVAFIEKLHPDSIVCHFAGEAVLVCFDSGKPGPVLLFRADMDALPIAEINHVDYRSVIEGVSHACGHDGHSTILCGLAERLSEQRPTSGIVYLLFQPAEETGEGAARVHDDAAFTVTPDYVFALHNLPGFEMGSVVVKDGLFSAAVNSIAIKLAGKTSHAAEPEFGINPALAIADIIIAAAALENKHTASEHFQLLTAIHINMGELAYGVSAGEAGIHYTLRCWNNAQLQQLEKDFLEKITAIAEKYSLQMDHCFTQTFYANNNNPFANKIVRQAASWNGIKIEERTQPFKWAEDFGYFSSKYKGCMFGLGAGIDHPALHNPDYDFPDSILTNGINIFHSITKILLDK